MVQSVEQTCPHHDMMQASLADSFVDLVSQAVIAIADIRCGIDITHEMRVCSSYICRGAACHVAAVACGLWFSTPRRHRQPHERRAKHADPRFPVGKARLEAVGVILCACLMTLSSFEVGLPMRMRHKVLRFLPFSSPDAEV